MYVQNIDKDVFQTQGDHTEESGKADKRAKEESRLFLFHLLHLPKMLPPFPGSNEFLKTQFGEVTAPKPETGQAHF